MASSAGTRFHPSGLLTQCGHCHSEDSAKGEGCQGDLRYAQVGVPYFLPIPHLARLCNESSLCAVSASALLNPTLVTRTAMLRGSAFHVAPPSTTMRALLYTRVSVETSWQRNLHPTGDDSGIVADIATPPREQYVDCTVEASAPCQFSVRFGCDCSTWVSLPFIRLGCD